MLIVVDPHSGVPVYRQVMDQVKFHVASRLLQPGDELPSTRALSSQLGVNPMTVSKAYSYLERERVIERRPGLPLVVRQLELDQIQEQKIDQLRESLAPTVTMVRQLGMGHREAAELFLGMLAAEEEDRSGNPGGDQE